MLSSSKWRFVSVRMMSSNVRPLSFNSSKAALNWRSSASQIRADVPQILHQIIQEIFGILPFENEPALHQAPPHLNSNLRSS